MLEIIIQWYKVCRAILRRSILMKILLTTDAFEPIVNGVVTSVMNLYTQLKAKGHDVRILTLAHEGCSRQEGDIYFIRSFGVGIYPDARATVNYKSRILGEIIKWGPEIVHSQTEFCSFLFAKKIAKRLDIPNVHTYHTLYQDYTSYFTKHENIGKKAVVIFSRRILKTVDRVIVPTVKTREILESYHVASPIDVIPNGIDFARFKRPLSTEEKLALRQEWHIPKENKVIVTVGRVGKEKNLDEILLNVATLMKERKDITLMIVGDGPYKQTLQERVKEMGIERSVVFTGMIDQKVLYRYYKSGDIFVSASTSETQGLTYIEALANEIPIVCRKDECLEALLKEGYNGYSYESSEEFLEKISDLLDHPDHYKAMKAHTMPSIACYSSEIFADRVEAVYEKVLKCREQEARDLKAESAG